MCKYTEFEYRGTLKIEYSRVGTKQCESNSKTLMKRPKRDFFANFKKKSMRIPTFLFLFFCYWGWAQDPARELPEIVITATRLSDSTASAPLSVIVVEPRDLARTGYADISPAVNAVPGVLMQSGSLNTSRISVRGIGARTPFGTNRIRAFYGPIPLTSGDGETTIEDLDIESLGQIEFVRGPRANVYGAGLGGAILISPAIPGNAVRSEVSTTHGSYGLQKGTYAVSARNIGISYHHLSSDGWRQNSGYRREGTTITTQLAAGKNGRILALGNFTSVKAFIPSSLNAQTFDNDPRSAAPTWLAAKGFEQYRSWMAGAAYQRDSGKIRPALSVFVSGKNAYEPRPFDILDQQSIAWGARGEIQSKLGDNKHDWRVRIGAEYFGDRLDQVNFENLYAQNNGNGSLQGSEIASSVQARSMINGFAQATATFGSWNLQAGFNVNASRFVNVSDNARINFSPVWSPEAALSRKISPGMVYVSVGKGFSMPSVQESLDAARNFNKILVPETGINYEAGTKLNLFGRRLRIETAFFWMDVRNLLVARRIADDQYVGINAGRTSHRGLEFFTQYEPHPAGHIQFSAFVSGSAGRFEFSEFVDQKVDYSGNRLTGVPSSKFAAGLNVNHLSGLYAAADVLYVDRVPANDANTVYADSYRTFHARLGWSKSIFEGLTFDFAAGMSNLGNEKYAAMVQVNALAAPGQQPRYFYPGMPAQIYTHLRIVYLISK